MADFKLPGSSYEVVSKILHAYVLCGDGKTTLDEVSKKAGLDNTIVSRNNGFLVSVGALGSGRDKALTPAGKKLALAIGNNLQEDAMAAWKELLLSCEGTRSVVEMVQVQKGVQEKDFSSRVAQTLGVVIDASTKTGLNALTELLTSSKTLKYADERYTVHDEALAVQEPKIEQQPSVTSVAAKTEEQRRQPVEHSRERATPSVHINVQVHISPESTPEQIDKIFESMAKHLRPTL